MLPRRVAINEMIVNDRLEDLAKVLKNADSIYLFPHLMADGDCFGSAAALCEALQNMCKICRIITEDKIPDYLMFMDRDFTLPIEEVPLDTVPDVAMLIDCGTKNRIPERFWLFEKGVKKLCIDHHETNDGLGDLNYVDPKAAATGELIYDLLCVMESDMTPTMAGALFAAITTDTGNYQYANTTAKSHEVTVKLYEHGLDAYPVSQELFENTPLCKVKLYGKIMEALEIFADGEGAISVVTQDMLALCGARMEDSEGIVGDLRAIAGVEIAAMVKEQEDRSTVKVSMRAKNKGNMAELAKVHDGGGHEKAAGCTFTNTTWQEVKSLLMDEITAHLKEA